MERRALAGPMKTTISGSILPPIRMSSAFGHAPLSCAAGVAAVQAYEEDGLIENAAKVGDYLGKRLKEIKEEHPSVGDVRQIGLFSVVEIVKNKSTKEPSASRNASKDELKTMNEIGAYLREHGLFTFLKANMIFIVPPLCITEEQIDEGMNIIKGALKISDKIAKT